MVDAVKTGRNQIFLSASKAQAHIFKEYIKGFAYEACGVELVGDPIVLPDNNQASLSFLGTNYRTAQGHHGNFYFDEFFWTFGFTELNKVASAMALHKNGVKPIFQRHLQWRMKLSHSGMEHVITVGDLKTKDSISMYHMMH